MAATNQRSVYLLGAAIVVLGLLAWLMFSSEDQPSTIYRFDEQTLITADEATVYSLAVRRGELIGAEIKVLGEDSSKLVDILILDDANLAALERYADGETDSDNSQALVEFLEVSQVKHLLRAPQNGQYHMWIESVDAVDTTVQVQIR